MRDFVGIIVCNTPKPRLSDKDSFTRKGSRGKEIQFLHGKYGSINGRAREGGTVMVALTILSSAQPGGATSK